jgi:hypothetical protein
MITQPLHVAIIRGHQLRFYRTPNNDGRPDLPWHCVDDLYRCMGLSREFRRQLQRWHLAKKVTRTVATADGLVTIAPHCMAQGAIGAWKETGGANIEHEYAMEGSIALGKLTAGLVFPDQVVPWAAAALKRHEGEVPR